MEYQIRFTPLIDYKNNKVSVPMHDTIPFHINFDIQKKLGLPLHYKGTCHF
jgi:hypothetical protein